MVLDSAGLTIDFGVGSSLTYIPLPNCCALK